MNKTLNSLGLYGLMKTRIYLERGVGYSYWIAPNSNVYLMAFGMANQHQSKDIVLFKKDFESGFCDQFCFNYHNEINALCGKKKFNIKRILVYQLS